jgi:hypothetical protein
MGANARGISLSFSKTGARAGSGRGAGERIILAFGVAVIFEIADKIANGVPPASGLMLGLAAPRWLRTVAWRCSGASVRKCEHVEHVRVLAQ